MWKLRWLAVGTALVLVVGACGAAATPGPTPTPQPTATAEPTGPAARAIEAPAAAITVDGDPSDWAAVPGLETTLEGIKGVEVEVEPAQATVKVAHDDQYAFVLFEVVDDYDWNAEDAHLSGSSAVMWAVQTAAGPHMGPEDPEGKGTSLGMVDIWHWELECAASEQSGGEVSEPGEGQKPGNDSGCNFDDEWATSPDDREDDGGSGAENSLLGVWSHSNPTAGGAGTWVFEIRRPLQTGDEQDAQFAAGGTALLALAYWDADQTASGWEDDGHSQSSNQGWIEVTFD